MTDIRDVILRIESHLTRKQIGHVDSASDSRNGEAHNGDESVILVAHEILPSQAMSLGDLPIAGIVTEAGRIDQPRRDPRAEPRHPGRLGG